MRALPLLLTACVSGLPSTGSGSTAESAHTGTLLAAGGHTGGGPTRRGHTGGAHTGGHTGGPVASGETASPPEACPAFVTPAPPFVVYGDNTGATDDYAPSCGGGGYGDQTWVFTAPVDGYWFFWTDNAATGTYNTLAVYDACGGVELDCAGNDYGISWVAATVHAGDSVVLVVDGDTSYHPEGPYQLVGLLSVPL